ncbi:Phosphoethanolamine N-methyltransferase 1-like protein 1 [Colletotrichum chlorophyti]|uniref:Phosphoethanolamine N-methyltransferase 1-like protein 1 n=1 Tax=Colletotrichum chlorophyti TaxID=708187 RepID=A0A1Q8RAF3_9PEZI|nr:Phosphoethanolamine N-methyltransferase 1-like protein 1 [Colletotrichum chlorophyti]
MAGESAAEHAPLTAPGVSLPVISGTPTNPIEADDAEPSEDGYITGSDAGSNASTSLASSIRDFNFENKRRYHKFKEGRYLLPNDNAEQEREDMKHALVVYVSEGSLHSAPINEPQKVLDVGTGTGIWPVDMGDEYPEAEIIGIDLSPIQPGFVPPNVHFIVDDAEAEWLYPDNSFDYIHLRHMAAFIKDWPKLLAQAYRVLKPGGWVELQEMRWKIDCDDGTQKPDYSLVEMTNYINEGLHKFGYDLYASETNPQRLETAGFTNLIHDVKKVPLGPWPKDSILKKIGRYCQAVLYDGLHAITIGPLTRGLGWTAEEVEVFLVKCRKDTLDMSTHSYVYYHAMCGQTPIEDA